MGADEVELVKRLRDRSPQRMYPQTSLEAEAADAIERLAARVAQLEADGARLDWLERASEHMKFRDMPWDAITPRDAQGDSLAKYLGEDGWTLRVAVDAARGAGRE